MGALRNHVANEKDAYNPVSRLTMKRETIPRREEEGKRDLSAIKAAAKAGPARRHRPWPGSARNWAIAPGVPFTARAATSSSARGAPKARLVFVGEAPGEEEDNQGRPFVGRAGQLLTKIIDAMGLKREEVYICNILKCRPPGNRNPKEDEIATCEPFLLKQLEAINPAIICALGTFAAKTLLRTESPISAIRGKFHDYHGRKLMPTYHPAYLLRNPDAKKLVWEDVQKIMKIL